MQTNNQLYEESLVYAGEHQYRDKYLPDHQKLGKQGFVTNEAIPINYLDTTNLPLQCFYLQNVIII